MSYLYFLFEKVGEQVKYGVRPPKLIWGPCEQIYRDPATPPPPHLGSYTWALLVSQDRRHLFVTSWVGGLFRGVNSSRLWCTLSQGSPALPLLHVNRFTPPQHSYPSKPISSLHTLVGCALTFASEAKFEIEAKISFRLEAKKSLISHDSLRCKTAKI